MDLWVVNDTIRRSKMRDVPGASEVRGARLVDALLIVRKLHGLPRGLQTNVQRVLGDVDDLLKIDIEGSENGLFSMGRGAGSTACATCASSCTERNANVPFDLQCRATDTSRRAPASI